jgi:hypothetical protein
MAVYISKISRYKYLQTELTIFERLPTRVGTSYKTTAFLSKNSRIAAYTPVFYVPTRVRDAFNSQRGLKDLRRACPFFYFFEKGASHKCFLYE